MFGSCYGIYWPNQHLNPKFFIIFLSVLNTKPAWVIHFETFSAPKFVLIISQYQHSLPPPPALNVQFLISHHHLLLRLETVSADNFITFNCEARTARFVSQARSALDTVIEDKVSNPSPTTWSSKHGRILGIITELLDTELEGIETDYYEDWRVVPL